MPLPPLPSRDAVISVVDSLLRTLSGSQAANRPYPAPAASTFAVGSVHELSADEQRTSGALMRVNHVGEVCAQALYEAQALATRSPVLRAQFREAAREETDHLAWTSRRLSELNARPSLLNPLWFAGSFALGLVAGSTSDRHSLGFVVETERQVEEHLARHLDRLPASDAESRAVVRQMKDDEARHGQHAQEAGAAPLPLPVKLVMRLAAKVMTATAHYI
ncbi:MAG: putative ubiquinone biosynthesis protein [Rhizobacter sp.]|nr:putative ubiquinone biosynthesis protein [Rhizobacter sp.]